MTDPISGGSSEARLLGIMQQLAHLDWYDLLQLQEHLGEMIEQMQPETLPENAPEAIIEVLNDSDEGCSHRDNGYIEWKSIRHGDKVYGPYPYWRFVRDGKHHSIYLKELAQQTRQSASAEKLEQSGEDG